MSVSSAEMWEAETDAVELTPDAMPSPRPWRLAAGFLLAPLVPAALWSLLSLGQQPISGILNFAITVALIGGFPAALVLGVPVYLLLRRRLRPKLPVVVFFGGLIAAMPWLAIMGVMKNPTSAAIGTCQTVLDGQTTWCGYLVGLKFLSLIFGFGAVGGLTFWIAVVWKDPRLAGKEPPSETSEA
jgi:hypothetical protein